MTDSAAPPPTTADLLLARLGDGHPGLLFEDRSWSWDEVVHEGARRAALALELRRPDRPFHIGVLLDNEPDHLFWIVGAALAGAATVGINPTRRGVELAHDVAHTDCQLVVTSHDQRHHIDGLDLGDALTPDRVVEVDGGAHQADLDRLSRTDPHEVDRRAGPGEPLLLLFTSGSTGAPKAVVCSQARFAGIAASVPGTFGITRDDVCYSAMPMFHGNALMASFAFALGTGATWAIRRRFSASGFLPDVRRFGATYINYVGRSLAYILATPERPDDADNTLRLAFGTEATDRDMAEFTRRFGCPFAESYGSSEGQISIIKTPDAPPTSLGLPREGAEVKVVDPTTGEECPRARFGEHGQLVNPEAIGELVRTDPAGFEGYYGNPEATAERLHDGWYWSGDLAYRDEEGWYYFAGRGADWLRVDSENFAASPIERILARHPDVLVPAVFPVPDVRTGDQVMAALELAEGATFDGPGFDAFLTAQADLGTKWAPRFVRIVDRMPLTGTNKIDKQPLRAQRWEGPAQVWWRPQPGDPLQPLQNADRDALRSELAANDRLHLLT
jgi:fatty-acyl-CoA synthase